jgi:hypothetical protein
MIFANPELFCSMPTLTAANWATVPFQAMAFST